MSEYKMKGQIVAGKIRELQTQLNNNKHN